eukprot:5158078-Pleurochrysis_carterae.AAC.1
MPKPCKKTYTTHLRRQTSLSAARADALDSSMNSLLRLRWFTTFYMLAYVAVISFFELGSHAIRVPDSTNPTRARHTPRILMQSVDLQPIVVRAGRAACACVFLIGDACTFALNADERFHDYVFTALFGLTCRNSNHDASRQTIETCEEPSSAGATRRAEPCPASLRRHAQALYASHGKRHSGKHNRGLAR